MDKEGLKTVIRKMLDYYTEDFEEPEFIVILDALKEIREEYITLFFNDFEIKYYGKKEN